MIILTQMAEAALCLETATFLQTLVFHLYESLYKDLPEDKLDEEMLYLNEHVYPRAVGVLPTDRFNAKIRYSKRV